MRKLPPLLQLRQLAGLGLTEWRSARGRPQPRLWVRGFFSDRAGLYPLGRFASELFLTDWEIETRLGRINPAESLPLLGDKLLFHLLLDRLGLPVILPELAGITMGGRFVPLGPFASWEEAARAPLIAKPLRGSGGRGVIRVAPGARPPRANGLLIERCVAAHPYAQAIFPGALNTARVMTARDPDDGSIFIFGTAHRFGTRISAPTDNRKQGGIVSAIAEESGILTEAIGLGAGNRRTVHCAHPETGAPIVGVAVPHWQQVKDAALVLAQAFPALLLVGWDFAVTDAGPVLIEGNAALPNPNLMQAHAPLLARPRVRRFCEYHGIISGRRALRAAHLAPFDRGIAAS